MNLDVRVNPFCENANTKAAKENFEKWKAIVSDVFIKAVLECDKETIIELAEAAAFFKDKLGNSPAADPVRLELLKIKGQPGCLPRRTFTIRQIAARVYKDRLILREHSADGFSKLRRQCKEMGIRISPSRKTANG